MYEDPRSDAPVQPAYREAYPTLKLVGVRARWREGMRECEWYNRHHGIVGRMEVGRYTSAELQIMHEGSPGRLRQETFIVRLEPTFQGIRRPYAFCPDCQKVSAELYFAKDRWLCAACHGLVPLKTLLSKPEKMLMQFRALHAEVGGHEPKALTSRSYEPKRLKMDILRARLATMGITQLREELRPRVKALWLGPKDEANEERIQPIGYAPPTSTAKARFSGPWF